MTLRDILQPKRLTAIVETGVDKDEAPPYQRMLDEGLCTARNASPDTVAAIVPLDLLKITGPEFDLGLLGAGPDKVAVHTSVSFFPKSTFGVVDGALRCQGFIAHCFADCYLTPIVSETTVPHPDPHQLGSADIFYVRDFLGPGIAAEQWKHLALLAHHVCGSFDLAMHAVTVLAKGGAIAPDAPAQYRKVLEVA